MAIRDSPAPPAAATNAELIRWAFERLNARDVDALRPFWTEDTVERFPDRTCTGPHEIAAYFHELMSAIPDMRIEIVSLAAEGDDVFVQWRLTGTHEGRLQGVEGTGRPIAIDGIDRFVLRDRMVVSNFVVSDRMQYAQQIGMLPPDGSVADRGAKRAFNARTALMRRLRR